MSPSSGRFVPLAEQVAAQAARTPAAVAVVSGGTELTYADLLDRADRIAAYLLDLGAGPEQVVGVALRRGPDLAAALLAVWRAGAAYLPLAPDDPSERLEWLLSDAGARVVLTHESLVPALPGSRSEAGVRVVPLDAERPRIDAARAPAGLPAAAPGSIAYAIYTSGSTGRPKGVLVTQEGIANRVGWTVRTHGLGSDDRVLQKTSPTFDAAAWEVFAPLVSGGTVVMAPPGAERDPAAIVRAVAEHRITVLQAVPSVLRLLAGEPELEHGALSSLRLLFSAGEPLDAELCHRLLRHARADLWNTYGPTECSIDVTAHRFDPAQTAGPVPIGRPIDGMRVLVLDAAGRPVPIGVPGELHAGGPGVARGYTGRPDLTAERFVPDPRGPAGTRLYRTGDLVRWRPDGTLEYLGRLDQQVKVNGVRIEPGEIEAALRRCPGVTAAAVTVRPATGGGHRLVAHVVGDGTADLRRHLRTTLPAPMIPSEFVALGALPLTSSGKVDRAALARDTAATAAGTAPHQEPRTADERRVAGIWAELLRPGDGEPAPRIGADDDFFRLGGSSLLLTRLAERLGAAFGHDVEITDLYAAVTVAEQARLARAAGDQDAAGRPRPVPRDGRLPLSAGQRRLWFLDRMDHASAEWTTPVLMRPAAGADESTIRAALEGLAARHEILRTRYDADAAGPFQIVEPAVPVELRVAEAADEDELTALLRDELGKGFDLARGPVWRALLARLPGGDRTLLLTVHHIACDGWSSVVLERDFTALLEGRAADLPELPVQYADYAAWQDARDDDRQRDHWVAALADLERFELPADRPRPAERDPRGAVVAFTVPAPVAGPVLEIGRRAGATPFATLLAAFATLLARHGGRWDDVVIGTSVAGRDRPEVEDLVGFFLNSLVLRCDLDPEAGFDAAARRVRQVARTAFAHQDLPFDRLVDTLAPHRDRSRTPLYQIMFDLQEEGLTSRSFDDVLVQRSWRAARTDLTLSMQRAPGGELRGLIEYATALFDEETVRRLAGRLVRLLGSIAARPELPLGELDLFTDDDHAAVRAARGTAGAAAPVRPSSVPELVDGHVSRTPWAVAVTGTGGGLSYEELRRKAEGIAATLRPHRLRAEETVGVLLSRTPVLPAALLGVWRAGGAYLPLHPDTPPDRLGHMLNDSGVRVVVTESALLGRLKEVYQGPYVLVDVDCPEHPADPGPAPPPDPASLAYVVYTSGSTGRPKGVQVRHDALAAFIRSKRDHYGFGADDAWLAVHSISFDIAAAELFVPLAAGGRVVLAGDAEVDDRAAQLTLVDTHGVTHLGGSPAHWRLLLEAGFGRRPVVAAMGGEACPPDLARDIRSRVRRLVNEYGPTEATIAATRWDVPADAAAVPIGTPFPGVRVHVVDERLRPLPIGVPGELCVGGDGLARGYAGDPARTAAAFVPDPFGPPGGRLYRTGDLCRLRPDGSLTFLGRRDGQVKIRGHRVEPGEIEAVLTGHPLLREAAVVLRERGESPLLVAYCEPAVAGSPDTGALAAYAARSLPDYMVPQVFMTLDALPRNLHGKVDRAALPVPAPVAPAVAGAGGGEPAAPRDPIEEHVAEVWTELLGADDAMAAPVVGVRDDFFRLGGNSLLAARMVTILQDEYGVALPLRAVFDGPTVEEVARALERAVAGEIAGATAGETPGATAGETPGATAGETPGATAGETPGATAGETETER
ncbi:amino acid adenylation domain-containing protein [Spirillospora sp. NPDC047279]|uniref:amino acid adenylation domain-containing protein n=1 Tax=Spirillospora sp. NPDC047279 TaxID=3155478 RepID=UPI003406FC4A